MYCEKCQQTFADELICCPRCTGRRSSIFGRTRLPAMQPLSDPRIDLGSPVQYALGAVQPPSGASFISWTVLLQKRKKTLDETPAEPLVWGPTARLLAALLLGFVLGCLVCLSVTGSGARLGG